MGLVVNLAAMSHFKDQHSQNVVFDFVDDAVIANPDSITGTTLQFFATGRGFSASARKAGTRRSYTASGSFSSVFSARLLNSTRYITGRAFAVDVRQGFFRGRNVKFSAFASS
jgi:hypothetical protein